MTELLALQHPFILFSFSPLTLPHHFHCKKKLGVAEANCAEGNSEAEAEEKQHVGFIVVFVVGCVPVWTTGALQAFWDVPGEVNTRAMGGHRGFASLSPVQI